MTNPRVLWLERRGVLCKPLIEWRDSQLHLCVKGVTGVSPGRGERREALCIQREGQSAIDTDPGDTIKTDTHFDLKTVTQCDRVNVKVTFTSVYLISS